MEKIVEQTLLYDFYGELLTPHQKTMYEEYVLDDLSISEIAKEHDISRQGVHDQLKRIENLLTGYENTLHLIEKFLAIKKKVNDIKVCSSKILKSLDNDEIKILVEKIDVMSKEIIDEL